MFLLRPTMILFLVLIALLALSAGYTAWRTQQISAAFKPDGRFAEVDGTRLHYHFFPAERRGAGTAPVLVFLHGASGNAYDPMLVFKPAFQERYSLLFVDRPAFGFSERNGQRDGSLEGQARLIDGLLEHLEIEQAVVIGHSFGAAVTAALALQAPQRVAGMAFIAPVSHPWPGGVDWYYKIAALPLIGEVFTRTVTLPLAERLAPAAIGRVFSPAQAPADYARDIRLPLLYRPASFRANCIDIATLQESVARQSKHYTRLEQPALVVTGTQDTVVWPSIHSEGLFRDLPNAELLMLEGAGHMPHHTHTGEIVTGIERLVARVQKTAAAAQ